MDSDAQAKFDTRIAEIHGLAAVGGAPVDLRHEEFMALADAFLGAGFDRQKLELVEILQIDLHRRQTLLYAKLERRALTPEAYADACNALSGAVAMKCQAVLGRQGFQALFGAPPGAVAQIVDKEVFVASHACMPQA